MSSQEPPIQLHCGECNDYLASLPAGCAHLIFADPPYNLSGDKHITVESGRRAVCNKGEWDIIEDIHEFNARWIAQCIRVLRDDGTIWISGTLHNHPSVGVALKKLGLWIVNDIVWHKRNAPPLSMTNRLKPSFELLWLAAKSKRYYFDYARAKRINNGKQMSNFWDIPARRHITPHKTEKPESLLARIIALGSRPGDTVVDPFMGSGTTGAVARQMRRSFIGCEINPQYFAWAKERIERSIPLPLVDSDSADGEDAREISGQKYSPPARL